jgi:hypothetical protein
MASSDGSPSRRPAIAAQLGRKRRKLGGSLQRVLCISAGPCAGPWYATTRSCCGSRAASTAARDSCPKRSRRRPCSGAPYSSRGGGSESPALEHKPLRCITLPPEQPISLAAARPREIMPPTAIHCHFVLRPKNEQDAGMSSSPSLLAPLGAFGNIPDGERLFLARRRLRGCRAGETRRPSRVCGGIHPPNKWRTSARVAV